MSKPTVTGKRLSVVPAKVGLLLGLSALLPAAVSAAIAPTYQFQAAPASTSQPLLLALTKEDVQALSHPLLQDAQVKAAVSAEHFTGEQGQLVKLHQAAGYPQLWLAGVGSKTAGATELSKAGAALVPVLDKSKLSAVTLDAGQLDASALLYGISLRAYQFDQLKSKAKPAQPVTITTLSAALAANSQPHQQQQALAAGVMLARDLTNLPAGHLSPEQFAGFARELKQHGVKVTVLDEKAIEKQGMGALHAVGRGSARPPRLVIAHWQGSKAAPVAIIGKGITFDTGGYNLKTDGESIVRMTSDMAGAAAALGTIKALALQKAPVNVVAVMAMAENMISDRAYLPGDVIKTAQGLTVQITSTDAEGRLVLADAMWYAREQYKPAAMVDIATLTGSKVGALGSYYAGLFSENEQLVAQLTASGQRTGEKVWRLPLSDEFASEMNSEVADLRNTGKSTGASTAAWFLKQFAGDTAWAHLDIAGNALSSADKGITPAGATGFGVQLLTDWTLQQQP